MIVYSPINGEVLTNAIKFLPKQAFIMTQLGQPIPEELSVIRKALDLQLQDSNFKAIDASSLVTGKDFLDKIWKIILGLPLGIAILTKDMPERTIVFHQILREQSMSIMDQNLTLASINSPISQ